MFALGVHPDCLGAAASLQVIRLPVRLHSPVRRLCKLLELRGVYSREAIIFRSFYVTKLINSKKLPEQFRARKINK